MQANEVIRTIMKDKKISQGEVTQLLGMKSQSGVSQALSRDMRASMILRFLSALDCKLTVTDTITGEEYEITE